MSEVTLGEVIHGIVESQTSRLNTSLPGIIVKVRDDGFGTTLDVQPTVNLLTTTGMDVQRPTILNVPVFFPLSSTGGLQFELNVGDPVLLIFSQRGLEVWKNGDGKAHAPVDMRMFDPRDCIALPCLFPKQSSPANPGKHKYQHDKSDVVLVHNIGRANEVEIRLKKSGDVVINTTGSVTVNSTHTEVNSTTAVVNATTTVNGVTEINGNTTINGATTINGPTTIVGVTSITGATSVTGAISATTGVSAPTLSAATSLTVAGKQMAGHVHGGVQNGTGTTGGPV